MKDNSEREELKQRFEQQMLDGDGIQRGQMLASTEVFEYVADLVAETRQATRQAVLTELLEKAPKNIYTLEQLKEMNAHLDSRSQQQALSKSEGIIETNNAWVEALEKIRRNT
jgi:hypothetical protein